MVESYILQASVGLGNKWSANRFPNMDSHIIVTFFFCGSLCKRWWAFVLSDEHQEMQTDENRDLHWYEDYETTMFIDVVAYYYLSDDEFIEFYMKDGNSRTSTDHLGYDSVDGFLGWKSWRLITVFLFIKEDWCIPEMDLDWICGSYWRMWLLTVLSQAVLQWMRDTLTRKTCWPVDHPLMDCRSYGGTRCYYTALLRIFSVGYIHCLSRITLELQSEFNCLKKPGWSP